jgi:two-component system sensor histidine kinase UhpB
VDNTRLAEGLQGVMDEIRLMIESDDAAGTTLETMLGVFEARVRPRVEDAGFYFGWQVDVDDVGDLSPQAVLQVFRIMQEAVANALRHSGGDRIDVVLSGAEDAALVVTVADNGKGAGLGVKSRKAGAGGHGMTNMRDRATSIGGRLDVDDTGPGLTITLRAPARVSLERVA